MSAAELVSGRAPSATRRRKQAFNPQPLLWLAVLAVLVFTLFPVLWMLATSVKSRGEFFTSPPIWTPSVLNFGNYTQAWGSGTAKGLADSLTIAASSTALCLALGTPLAYAIARYRFGGENFAFWILSTRMFPPIATILPLFLLYRKLGLIDTYSGLILAYTVFNLPFAVWLLRGFFEEVPKELEEAARVDGASLALTFWRVSLPLVAPGLVVTALFTFIFAWNEFFYALVFTRSQVSTLPVTIASYAGGHEILWGPISAAGVLAVLPVIVLALFLQRYLVRGLTLGGVKG